MDSAEAERLSEILHTQEARIVHQEEIQSAMAANISHLSSQLQALLGWLARSGVAAPPPTTPVPPLHSGGAPCKLALRTLYNGDPGSCKTFLIDCSIHFEFLPHGFPTERSKVAFKISHLTGRAKTWASAEWSRNTTVCDSLKDFEAALARTFDPVSSSREKAQELSHIRQGKD